MSLDEDRRDGEKVPGDDAADGWRKPLVTYLIGFVLAVGLTAASFATLGTSLLYGPGIPVALVVLAIAQMGVHLVFFLHITTGPDNLNNVLALAFGVLIVGLVVIGSLWIMTNMNGQMMPGHGMAGMAMGG